ncbi:MAG: 4-carboxy-4-hydroxy-2-oxoadipate aldolase/oxaloacetate decarboxylase [Alphaproteobacteria bacterium]|nr:4-carboxy-4-hydroxy-2-oxoadipate aldolase/oxaloacetate decarboxylase [Alphaproteobacteria bacterium]
MVNNVVVRNIDRADRQVVEHLGRLGVATVHEAMGRVGLMKPYMRPIYPGARLAASAVTILAHPGDNWMLHVATELMQEGDIAVVGTSAENTDGMFGELIATSWRAHGCVGLITDAGCRDTRELTEMKFPVWSRAVSAKGTVKETVGSCNVPVVVAGIGVNPGDVIVADDDGVVVVPRREAAAVAKASQDREDKEAVSRKELQEGTLALDRYGWREMLEKKGLRYVDRIEDLDSL